MQADLIFVILLLFFEIIIARAEYFFKFYFSYVEVSKYKYKYINIQIYVCAYQSLTQSLIKRHHVAGAVLQTPPLLIQWLINSVSD